MRFWVILIVAFVVGQLAGPAPRALGGDAAKDDAYDCSKPPAVDSTAEYRRAWDDHCKPQGGSLPTVGYGPETSQPNPSPPACGMNCGPGAGTSFPPTPTGGAASAGQAASTAAKIVGTKLDSQNDTHATTVKLSEYGSRHSRDSGTLDIIEGLLIMPINMILGGKLLDSGHKAHRAADELDRTRKQANDYAKGMTGVQGAAGRGGEGSASQGGSAADAHNGTGSSSPGPFGSEHGQELLGKFEDHFGVDRNEFVDAVNQAHGNPQAVGEFMQERTGDPKLGPEAIGEALDAYAANGGTPKSPGILGGIPEFAVSSGPAQPSAPVAAPAPSVKTSAVELPKRDDSLKDRLRKTLAERALDAQRRSVASRGGEAGLGRLEPQKDELLEQADRNNEKSEQTLFEVVHSKYVEKSRWLEKSR